MGAHLLSCSTPSLLVAGAAVALFAGSDLASAQRKPHGLQCGDTITRDTVLKRDLNCGKPTNEDFGLSVQGPATLDLNGHTVNCSGDATSPSVCISLVGAGAQLQGSGLVIRLGTLNATAAIVVDGDGGHRISGIQVVSDVAGFLVEGAGNQLILNTILSNTCVGANGITVTAPDNRLVNNFLRQQERACPPGQADQVGGGIVLEQGATSTVVLGNAMIDTGSGLTVISDRNLIEGNEVRGSEGDGIRVFPDALNNVVLGNLSLDNGGKDFFDGNVDCDDNVYVANQFDDARGPGPGEGTDQPCIH